MKQTIYVDVLICVNLFINYFLLLGVAKFLKIKVKRLKIIVASIVAALCSLYIFIPKINFILSFIVKVLMATVIVLCAFGFFSVKQLIKTLFCFFSMNFAFCGSMFAIWYLLGPKNLVMKNGIVYFNISPIMLVIATLISYVITRILNRFTGQEIPDSIFCEILIEQDGQIEKVKAKVDTGNDLKEPFSQLPVLVVEKKCIERIIPLRDSESKFRVVPFHTVSGDGILKAFKPDKVTVFNNKSYSEKDVYVAICDEGILPSNFEAIASLEIVQV